MTAQTFSPARALAATVVLLGGTLLGIAGTDLVLPAVPSLPAILGGTEATAQFVIAAFVAGYAIGLLGFGELGAHVDARRLFAWSLLLLGATSALAATATTIWMLIPLRFLQGMSGAAPAVFAPGFLRLIFADRGAVRIIGLFGSIESLVPALAPLAGAWLLVHFGWQSSFVVIALIAIPNALLLLVSPGLLPVAPKSHPETGYWTLLRDPVYMRYALSQSLSLGGLLVYVFGSATVITTTMGGTITHFVVSQIIGVSFYIVGANASGWIAPKVGTERLIVFGSVMSAAGLVAMVVYALVGGHDPDVIPAFWIFVNLGFGLRSPSGFVLALKAAHGNGARGSALVFLGFLLTSSLGTALVAPMISWGLLPLATGAALVSLGAVACVVWLPAMPEERP